MLVSRVDIQIAFCGFKRVSMGKRKHCGGNYESTVKQP